MLIPESPRPAIGIESAATGSESPGEPEADGVEDGLAGGLATDGRGSSSSARRRLGVHSAPGPAALPLLGDLVDTFRLEEAIGAGGMGAVFRALDTRLDRQVALKLL